jgi:hypothetical protein
MAFVFGPGGPQAGVLRTPVVPVAPMTAVPGMASAADDISIIPDQARRLRLPIAGGLPCDTPCGRGWAQREPGRSSL